MLAGDNWGDLDPAPTPQRNISNKAITSHLSTESDLELETKSPENIGARHRCKTYCTRNCRYLIKHQSNVTNTSILVTGKKTF